MHIRTVNRIHLQKTYVAFCVGILLLLVIALASYKAASQTKKDQNIE
jgi:CHASE3 domain sensor protein